MEQNQYGNQPGQQSFAEPSISAPVMTLGQWFITLLLMIIPIVNIVLLIVWAASKNGNPNRSNWAKAQLIMVAVYVLIWVLFAVSILGILGSIG